MKTIFDENTTFLFGGRDFEVVEWGFGETDENERTMYKDLKAAYVGTVSDLFWEKGIRVPGSDAWTGETEFLVLIQKDGQVVKYPNHEVSLFHV